MYCVHCGADNPDTAQYCQRCGKPLPIIDQDEPTVLTVPPVPSSPDRSPSNSMSVSSAAESISATPSSGVSSQEKAGFSEQQSPPLTTQTKNRRGYFIALALLVLVVIAAVGTYVYLNRSTPDKTLTTYCDALKNGDYQSAYNQLSTRAMNNLSETQFAHEWQVLGGVRSWTERNVQEQGSAATATVTFTLGNGQTALATIQLVNENGVWKVDAETITIT
jgi:NADH:ubiquinone oxidoreductase subunit 5 (subunit L)/multisubunit Na+/H+ antiporter MnhA subunit